MKLPVEFLSLRPIWTRRCLEIVWYVYFLTTVLQFAFLISVAYPAIGKADMATYFSFALQIVHSLATLALVRIVLELALTFLVSQPSLHRHGQSPQAPLADEVAE